MCLAIVRLSPPPADAHPKLDLRGATFIAASTVAPEFALLVHDPQGTFDDSGMDEHVLS
jgi:hypothetical protein